MAAWEETDLCVDGVQVPARDLVQRRSRGGMGDRHGWTGLLILKVRWVVMMVVVRREGVCPQEGIRAKHEGGAGQRSPSWPSSSRAGPFPSPFSRVEWSVRST